MKRRLLVYRQPPSIGLSGFCHKVPWRPKKHFIQSTHESLIDVHLLLLPLSLIWLPSSLLCIKRKEIRFVVSYSLLFLKRIIMMMHRRRDLLQRIVLLLAFLSISSAFTSCPVRKGKHSHGNHHEIGISDSVILPPIMTIAGTARRACRMMAVGSLPNLEVPVIEQSAMSRASSSILSRSGLGLSSIEE